MNSIDEHFMQRCLQLARNGLGTTYPNPMVGSVIVYEGRIIGEGWHRKSGEPHAEVLAIQSVANKELLPKSTIYVTLEPCSHFGKTPPCSDLILHHKIPRVVIGTIDPHDKVAGRGIERLKANGVNVTTGVLEQECQELNRRFFTFHQKKRPYIILKWAESTDGFLAPLYKDKKEPVWLSNPYSRQLVHKWRSEEQSILVGTQTVLQDNPSLNTRDWYGENPVRIILDRTGKISDNSQVKDQKIATIVVTEVENLKSNIHLLYENVIFDNQLPERVIELLYRHQLQSVLIEGGSYTLSSFIAAGLWDEARVFKTPVVLGSGIVAPKISGIELCETILNDQLITYYHD